MSKICLFCFFFLFNISVLLPQATYGSWAILRPRTKFNPARNAILKTKKGSIWPTNNHNMQKLT